MRQTATQKLFAVATGLEDIKAGMLISMNTDLILGNDITSPIAIDEMSKVTDSVFDPSRIVLVLDHFVPAKDIASAMQCKKVREFAKNQGIENFFDVGKMGIEHALLPEIGLIKPNSIIIGADSHTCTYGALGCFSTGVGSTDMAGAMATGKTWFKVPKAIKIDLEGHLDSNVSGKDVILTLIGMLGVDGASYMSLEFDGNLSALTIDDRLTICNMAVECGAKNAFMPVDQIAKDYLVSVGAIDADFSDFIVADSDAEYERQITLDLSTIRPTVALPHLPSNTKHFGIDQIERVHVDQVVIGSCTNGRISDMRVTAEVLSHNKIADGTRCIIIPGTMEVYKQCLDLGYAKIFVESGAIFSTPTCGPCLGGHMGILAENEVCVSTTNRNFVGRMGHITSKIYLVSPYTASVSAVNGYLSDTLD